MNLVRSVAIVFLEVGIVCAVSSCGIGENSEIGQSAAVTSVEIRPMGLEDAIRHGDVPDIERAISEGSDVNEVGQQGWSPLAIAMLSGKKQAFLRLLQLGADPNPLIHERSTSVMHLAAKSDDPDWLKIALANRGSPNVVNRVGDSPIFEAIGSIRQENLKTLIAHGADLDQRDSHGNSPLMAAAALNQYDFVLLLLENGADYHLTNNWNKSLQDRVGESNIDPASEAYQRRRRVIHWLEKRGAKTYR